MKIRTLTTIGLVAAGLAGYSGSALADAAAGKALFEKDCTECHEAADFKGDDAKVIQGQIEEMSAGKLKHKKALKLTAQQAADLAAYMVTGG